MFEDLNIIVYPDPRLKQACAPVEVFDESLRALAARMLELMRQHKGVGLAAPQVGKTIRMFVMNHNGDANADRVYINPVLSEGMDEDVGEEGCLSLPDVQAQISRAKSIRVKAQDLLGEPFEETHEGFIARIWQHECDHLDGVLITDRMGFSDRMKARRVLRELEQAFAEQRRVSARGKLVQATGRQL